MYIANNLEKSELCAFKICFFLIKFGNYYYEVFGYIGVTVQIRFFQRKNSSQALAYLYAASSWGEEQHLEFVVLPKPKFDSTMLDSTCLS